MPDWMSSVPGWLIPTIILGIIVGIPLLILLVHGISRIPFASIMPAIGMGYGNRWEQAPKVRALRRRQVNCNCVGSCGHIDLKT